MRCNADLARPAAWVKLCAHLDGIAIGSTVAALNGRGILAELRDAETPLDVDALARRYGARRGYLHVAFWLLAAQGLIHREQGDGAGQTWVCLTPTGRTWSRLAHTYDAVPALLAEAAEVSSAVYRGGAWEARWRHLLPNNNGAKTAEEIRVTHHVFGCLVASTALALLRSGVFDAFAQEPDATLTLQRLPGRPEVLAEAFDILAYEGWTRREDDEVSLTPEGQAVPLLAPQYRRPVAYLPLYAHVPDLLFGDGRDVATDERRTETADVDQENRIITSGEVFQRTCRAPFFDLALPLFDTDEPAGQPRYLVDIGSGDGTMLKELFVAIRDRTRRGQVLDSYPLVAIAAEYESVAERVSGRMLSEAGIPHLTVYGDIGGPRELAMRLSAQGIDMRDALHVSKSVIHNRRYRPPHAKMGCGSGSSAIAVRPDGELITGEALADSLVELFESWRPWIVRHGLIAIDAHTLDPGILARRANSTPLLEFIAAHGYSNQHLVEIDVHRRAAGLAGLHRIKSHEFGAKIVDHPFMSIDYYRVAD